MLVADKKTGVETNEWLRGGGRLQFNSCTGLCVHRNCVSMCHSKGNGHYLVAGFIRNVILYGNCKSIHVIVVTSFYVESGESLERTFRITKISVNIISKCVMKKKSNVLQAEQKD